MANAQRAREVMDSEDEPLSSSPANTSDAAANRFPAWRHVSPKDPEDAPQEAACTHRADTEKVRDLDDGRTRALAVDQQNSFVDMHPSKLDPFNTQLDTATSEGETADASHDTAKPPAQDVTLQTVPDITNTISESTQEVTQATQQEHASVSSSSGAATAPKEESADTPPNVGPNDGMMDNSNRALTTTKGSSDDTAFLQLDDHVVCVNSELSQFTTDPDHIRRQEDLCSTGVEARGQQTSSGALGRAGEQSKAADGDVSEEKEIYLSDTAQEALKAPSSSTLHDIGPTDASNSSILGDSAAPSGDILESSANEVSVMDTNSQITSTQSTFDSQTTISDQSSPTATHPIVSKTPQEITLAELKAQKAALLASLAALPAVQVLIEENATSDTELAEDDEPTEKDIMAAANKMVKEHIKLLHEYNELKDVGQGLMGLIADQRGVRIMEVQEEFGIDAKD